MPAKTEAGRNRWAKMTEEQREAARARHREWKRRQSMLRPPVAERQHVLVEVYCRPTRQRFFGITCDDIDGYWAACQHRASHGRRARSSRSLFLRAIAKHGAKGFRVRKLATFATQAEAAEAVRQRRLEQHWKRLGL